MTDYQILKRHKFLCKGKIPYDSESSAMSALIEKMTKPGSYLPEELSIYICRSCNLLHIGHEPKWRANGKRDKQHTGRREELLEAARHAHERPPFIEGVQADRSMRGS